MIQKIQRIYRQIVYSFPIQLVAINIKKNQMILVFWGILFAIVGSYLGKSLGIPFLFLDPEYLGKVDFLSFFLMGMVMSGFTMAFHITCYILDGYRYNF